MKEEKGGRKEKKRKEKENEKESKRIEKNMCKLTVKLSYCIPSLIPIFVELFAFMKNMTSRFNWILSTRTCEFFLREKSQTIFSCRSVINDGP